MRAESFFQFIVKEISKSNINRMSLPNFTRILRKKAQQVSTAQLFYSFRELSRIKAKNSQFHLSNISNNQQDRFKTYENKVVMKYQSYEKHTVICLQQIAIKLKQKHGYEQGVDMLKLYYLRLQCAIEYNLPYVNILQLFRQELLLKRLGEQVIDYVEIITKDPQSLSATFVQTVNLIVQNIEQKLQHIGILQLPHIKSILAKGQSYGVYDIKQSLLMKIDEIINSNKFLYNFNEIQESLYSNTKHQEVHSYYSLMQKDLIQKRLNYLYIDAVHNKNDLYLKENPCNLIKQNIGYPGRNITDQHLQYVFRKMTENSLLKPYLNIFQRISQIENQNQNVHIARFYMQYLFKHFMTSGNHKCSFQLVSQTLRLFFNQQRINKANHFQTNQFQILKSFYVLMIICRKSINQSVLKSCYSTQSQQIASIGQIKNINTQNIHKFLQKSHQSFQIDKQKQIQIKPLLMSFYQSFSKINETNLSDILKDQLLSLNQKEKTFIVDQLISWILNKMDLKQNEKQVKLLIKLLQIVSKNIYKKFSTEYSIVLKVISIANQQYLLEKSQKITNSNSTKQHIFDQKLQTVEQEEFPQLSQSSQVSFKGSVRF